MHKYKEQFIQFMLETGALSFGDFTTKSGRKTPYFINTGCYRTGAQLSALSGFYADAIEAEFGGAFSVLFGPAYKGIPLVVGTAMKFFERGVDVNYCFNRKEAKDHGEGGSLIGHTLQDGDRVLLVEDVTTAGTSIRETLPVLRAQADIQLVGLIVSVDRRERGTTERSALVELADEFSMRTSSIVSIDEIISVIKDRYDAELMGRLEAYRDEYGPR
jgi:orotate phosphoribosyltransferase